MRWHCLEENEAMQDVDDFECGRWWRKIWIFLLYRHAIAALFRPYFWWRICRRLLRLSVEQMLADDGYQWFVEQGGLTREMGGVFARRFFPEVTAKIWNPVSTMAR